jgi:hypothetical protein
LSQGGIGVNRYDSIANHLITEMQILFHCSHCFGECQASPSKDKGLISCPRCKKQLVLRYSDLHRQANTVDACAVCQRQDFYIRDEARKAWGLLFLVLGLASAWCWGDTASTGTLSGFPSSPFAIIAMPSTGIVV